MQPTDPEKIEQLDLVLWLLFVLRKLHKRLPMALECPLVKQAEGGFLLSNRTFGQYLIDCAVEVTRKDRNGARKPSTGFASRNWLACHELAEYLYTLLVELA